MYLNYNIIRLFLQIWTERWAILNQKNQIMKSGLSRHECLLISMSLAIVVMKQVVSNNSLLRKYLIWKLNEGPKY